MHELESALASYRWFHEDSTVHLIHTLHMIQIVQEPDVAVPKLIKSRKPFFPDMVIHIYKTVTQVNDTLRTLMQHFIRGSLELMTSYQSSS